MKSKQRKKVRILLILFAIYNRFRKPVRGINSKIAKPCYSRLLQFFSMGGSNIIEIKIQATTTWVQQNNVCVLIGINYPEPLVCACILLNKTLFNKVFSWKKLSPGVNIAALNNIGFHSLLALFALHIHANLKLVLFFFQIWAGSLLIRITLSHQLEVEFAINKPFHDDKHLRSEMLIFEA